tara:strand:+ start:73 stop:300 length:228 start_codon:yes stop_codon:yes gene_type:complete
MGHPKEAAQIANNWDGYGAGATSRAAIKTAEAINASWSPKSDEGLMLEYLAGGRELTVDIDAHGKITCISLEIVD